MTKGSLREKVLRVREDAIVDVVNRLLAEKGFEQMTVDEIAADVGIAKASLYKHFASKEALAAAALERLLERTLEVARGLDGHGDVPALGRLRALVRWGVKLQLAGEMPVLPLHHPSVRAEFAGERPCAELLAQLSDLLGSWILRAQADGEVDRALPPELVLYTLYARAADPVASLLKAAGHHDDEQLVEWAVQTLFGGLGARPS
jgi:TetR/AcrR family transcriptional regulator of autoinduction and epiphytic fitness